MFEQLKDFSVNFYNVIDATSYTWSGLILMHFYHCLETKK